MIKRMGSVFLALALLVVSELFAFAETMYLYDSEIIPENGMHSIAHRGYSAIAPENTLPAFQLAGEYGFWGAECDIAQTADGVWVLMHDPTVDRMTNGEGNVRDLTFSEISALTVDAGNGIEAFPNTRVPTLTEYLDICKQYGMHPVIEIKQALCVEQLPALAALLCAREEKDRMMIISFERELLAGMKALMPELPAFLLGGPATMDDVTFCTDNGIDGLDFSWNTPADVICAAQQAGLQTIVWTIDSLPLAEEFYQMGIEAVTTNTLVPGKQPVVPTTEAPKPEAPSPESTDEKPAERLNFFRRVIKWFKDLFDKIFGR